MHAFGGLAYCIEGNQKTSLLYQYLYEKLSQGVSDITLHGEMNAKYRIYV